MFRSLEESLKEVLGEEKIRPAYEKGVIESQWKKSVGSSVYKNTIIKNFSKGVLSIKAKTPVWRNELLFQKADILKKLNNNLEKKTIKDIRFL